MKILSRNCFFKSPEPVDILIFDECNSHIARRVISDKYSIGVFNLRPEDFFLGSSVIFKFLKGLISFDSREIKHQRGFLFGVFRQLYYIYLKSCIEIIKPKAVLTYIDNNSRFSWLAKHCEKFPFIAIQNGMRSRYEARPDSNYYVPHYFCFGVLEQELFPQLGYEVDNYYPIGSLHASLNLLPESKVEQKYDLLVVSSWRGDIGFQQDVQDTMRSMKIMDQLIAKYLNNHDMKVALIYRSMRNSEHWVIPELGLSEEEYYQDIYGDLIEHIETSKATSNIFPLIQQSKMIISCLSSAGLEGYGLKKKLLYCNFTGTNLYHQDIDDSILTTNSDYSNFSEKLTVLFQQDQEEYVEDHKETMQYYMNFGDNPRSVSTQISQKIDTIVENFK